MKIVHFFSENMYSYNVRFFKNNRKISNTLITHLRFCFTVIAPEMLIFEIFLALKESFLSAFSEMCVLTSRKCVAEADMIVLKLM